MPPKDARGQTPWTVRSKRRRTGVRRAATATCPSTPVQPRATARSGGTDSREDAEQEIERLKVPDAGYL